MRQPAELGSVARGWMRRWAAALSFVALSGGLLWAGPPADDPDCEARLEAAVEAISTHPKVKDWSREKLKSTTEFAVGNMLFVLLHEAGHGLISDLGLPVLGREEDAADAFATVTMLQMKTEFTHRTLVNAAKSWLISDRRAREERKTVIYYDVHALDLQRAYSIVCLMVGSDGERFEDLANEVNLPDERQETCVFDYSNASWSWEQALKPHLRAPEQQRTTFQIVYGTGGRRARHRRTGVPCDRDHGTCRRPARRPVRLEEAVHHRGAHLRRFRRQMGRPRPQDHLVL